MKIMQYMLQMLVYKNELPLDFTTDLHIHC